MCAAEAFERLRDMVWHARRDEGGELLSSCCVACVITQIPSEQRGGARECGIGV